VLLAAAVVFWVHVLPLSLESVPDANRAQLQYRGEDGHDHVYLGDYDSYLWLRHARNYLRTGTTCDAVVDGECRDTYANAPVGREMLYARSLHTAAIAELHRILRFFRPGYPLPATSFWIPVIVATLGTLPSYLLGERFGGPLGGLAAAILVGTNLFVLGRSVGSDDDIWNVVLPICMVWAAAEAVYAPGRTRRLLFALVAAAFTGLQAAAWSGWVFAYGVLVIGFVANLLLATLRAATVSTRSGEGRGAVREGALVLLVFVAAASCAGLAGAGEPLTAVPHALASLVARETAAPATTPDVAWPDTFATVAEVTRAGLYDVVNYANGWLYLVLAWIGLFLLLAAPGGRARWWHLAMLAGGGAACWYLLTTKPAPSSRTTVVLLALPLVAGAVAATLSGEPADDRERGAGLVVIAWFLAALSQTSSLRFLLLIEPPLCVLCGVAVGRVHAEIVARLRWSGWRRVTASGVVAALLAALLIPPVRTGIKGGHEYTPRMDDAWWDTLTTLRDTAPADAIVDTWWDYGHWVKYVAERRVSADGASLRTHVPYWIARAMVATTEREALGILRMLNCGSDATPDPEGKEGAWGKLVGYGIDGTTAQSTVITLANLDAPAARAALLALGLDGPAADDVLRSTHCQAPPAYLVLCDDLAVKPGWRQLGHWDFRRALIARLARDHPAPEAVSAIVHSLGLSQDAAQSAYAEAAALKDDEAVRHYISLDTPYLVPGWVQCHAQDSNTLRCEIGKIARPFDTSGRILLGFLYRKDAPLQSRLFFQRPGGTPGKADQATTPGALLIARADGMEEVTFPQVSEPAVGVLVDETRDSIVVGPPYLLRSMFTQLVFLHGRFTPHFVKVDEHLSPNKDRVVTWRIEDTASADPGLASPGGLR
jgi:hypothetical protein